MLSERLRNDLDTAGGEGVKSSAQECSLSYSLPELLEKCRKMVIVKVLAWYAVSFLQVAGRSYIL